jgi:hypothetical protein
MRILDHGISALALTGMDIACSEKHTDEVHDVTR